MRKLLAMGLCLILVVSFAGCSQNKLNGGGFVGSFGAHVKFPESWGDRWEYDQTDDTLTVYHKEIRSKYGDDKLATLFSIIKFPQGEETKIYAPTYELGEFDGYVYILTTPLESSYGIQLADGVLAEDYDNMAKDIPTIAKGIKLGEFTRAGGLARTGIYIEMENGGYGYATDVEKIGYKIINYTGEPVQIVLIPKLERNLGLQFEDKYEAVECVDGVGWCGTADTIEDEWEGEIELAWFKGVTEESGKYRLHFETADGEKTNYVEFAINTPKYVD